MSNALVTNQKEQIRQLLDSEANIGIIVGENQNIDTMAAALGLYLSLLQNGKNVQIVSKKDPTVELSNLVGIDKVAKSFEGTTKIFTISVPYREGEIEKVSYNIESDRLNVNLFAENAGIMLDEKDIKYIRHGSSPSLIFTIGVLNETEIENFLDTKAAKIIHIGKDSSRLLAGDVFIADQSFSSLSEIVTQIIIELHLAYDFDSFQNLMDGITYATRNFTLQNTSPYAFEAAGFLMQSGARRKDRNERTRKEEGRQNFPNEEHFLKQKNEEEEKLSKPQNFTETQVNDKTPDFPPSQIPDDWFLPKVFKGSKKGN